jgi:SAM-dependent methyltransferase
MKRFVDTIRYAWIDHKLQREVKKKFYQDEPFAKLDKALLTAYIFKNPYIISKNYLKKHGQADVHTYGETPLITYEKIAKECDLNARDTFLELGSGRGRGVLFLSHFYHCFAVGIERIPQFVKLSRHIAKKHEVSNAQFLCGDMLSVNIPDSSVIYLYGTCLEDAEISRLISRFKSLSNLPKIVTISYPLTDYDEGVFQIEKTFTVSFPWGETEAYLQTIKENI